MPLFKYTARDKTGAKKSGEISAPNKQALALLLREQGLLLTKSESRDGKGKKKGKSILSMDISGVPMIQKILFTEHLAVMLDAGLSISKALRVLSVQAGKKTLGVTLKQIQKKVEQGNALSEALSEYKKIFPTIYVNMVKMGEASGNLSLVLRQLALQMKKTYELTRKVKGAMYYPIVILLTMIGIGIMLVAFVLPKLVDVFEDLGSDLPLTTKILINSSKFIQAYWLYLVIGLGVLVILGVLGFRTEKGKKFLSNLGLRIPKIGSIIRQINISRFCRTFGSLMKSGVPIVDALNIVADTLGNAKYKEAVLVAAKEVKTGKSLHEALQPYNKIFIPIVTQIILVGEETGTLDQVLSQLADFYEEEVAQEMENISSIIEPILMLVLGGGVALLAVSIIGPIYSLSGQM